MNELRIFREEKGLTQNDFAKNINISVSFYTKIETGIRKPSYGFITKLKRVYPDFDVNVFFNT